MSDVDVTKYTATLKGGTGFDSPWLVIRADSAAELRTDLEAIREAELFEIVVAAATGFGRLYLESKPKAAGPAPQAAVPSGQPAYGTPSQAPAGPTASGLIPNISVHPTAACKCGSPLLFKKQLTTKYGERYSFECPNRDWQDEASKAAHDSKLVNV